MPPTPTRRRYSDFGAQVGPHEVRFSIFFPGPTDFHRGGSPGIKSIRVLGSFQANQWTESEAPELLPEELQGGICYEIAIPRPPEGFYEYKYSVEFEGGERRIVGGPCNRYGGRVNQNSGFVVGGSTPQDNTVRPVAGRLAPVCWKAGGRDLFYRTQPWLIALFSTFGIPLVYNGQEFGLDHWMPELWRRRCSTPKRAMEISSAASPGFSPMTMGGMG